MMAAKNTRYSFLQKGYNFARDSSNLMSGIDEREEEEEYSHVASVEALDKSRLGSNRPSNIKHHYDFQSHYTPSQTTKKAVFEI